MGKEQPSLKIIFQLQLLIIRNSYRANQNFRIFVSGQAISETNSVPMVPARLQILPPKTVSRPRIGSRPMCWSEITIKMWKYFENSFLPIFNFILFSFIWIRNGLSILYEYFMTPKWVRLNSKLVLYDVTLRNLYHIEKIIYKKKCFGI